MNYYEILIQTLNNIFPLTDDVKNMIMRIFKPAKISRGEYFIQAGMAPETIGFILKGLLRSYIIDKDGNDHTYYFYIENTFVSSYADMLIGRNSKFSIEALEDTELLTAYFRDFKVLGPEKYIWSHILNKIYRETLIYKHERELSFLMDDGRERYIQFINKYPYLEKRLKQYHIASYLGLTPVSLSRIKKKMK